MGVYTKLRTLHEKKVLRKVPPLMSAAEDKEIIRQKYADTIGVPLEEVQDDGMFFTHPSTAVVKYRPNMPRHVEGKFTCGRHRFVFSWIGAEGRPCKSTRALSGVFVDVAPDGSLLVGEKGCRLPFAIYKEVKD